MTPEDPVEVTNRDGSTRQGTLIDVLPLTASEYSIRNDTGEHMPISLYLYWEQQCDPDARVCLVELVDGTYGYPEDKVEVLVQ